MSGFKPNDLKKKDISGLADWQLLVAACHFGSTMTDCVDLDYSYTIDDDQTIYCGDVSLYDDIDLVDPVRALEQYADMDSWQEICREKLRETCNDSDKA